LGTTKAGNLYIDAMPGWPDHLDLRKIASGAASRVENDGANLRSGGRGGLVEAVKESVLFVLVLFVERYGCVWTKTN
jgi:hypothetical protein